MLRITALLSAILSVSLALDCPADEPPRRIQPGAISENDWPWWRGPNRNGIAAADQDPPRRWSETDSVLWSTDVPGRGHGSPTVVGDQIFLATATKTPAAQLVICYDRKSGREVWRRTVHRGGQETERLNTKASLASSTVACDGERVFINFWNNGAVYTTAYSRDGERLWQVKITNYVVHQGFASSPAIYDSLVFVSADNKAGGVVTALEPLTGETVWQVKRPKLPNYASPIILPVAGRDQLLFTGCQLVSSFAPRSGKTLWEVAGATTECVTSTVTDGELIFTSGGYPKNHVSAVKGDGSGELVWENNARVYVPSLIVRDGYLYGVLDAGIAACWDCATGKEMWKDRLGGTFSASPVMVGAHIFATNETGETFVFSANPHRFELIARNSVGDHVMATPAFCGSRIYMRVAHLDGDARQEKLYCLAKQSGHTQQVE